MNAREQFAEALAVDQKPIFYTVKKKGLLCKDRKIKFIIRTLQAQDLFDVDLKQEIMKEVSTGQNLDEATRIVAERIKKRMMSTDNEKYGKLIIQKGVVSPKIVDKKDDFKDDELPYSMIQFYWEIKLFLIKEIAKISPVFEGI